MKRPNMLSWSDPGNDDFDHPRSEDDNAHPGWDRPESTADPVRRIQKSGNLRKAKSDRLIRHRLRR